MKRFPLALLAAGALAAAACSGDPEAAEANNAAAAGNAAPQTAQNLPDADPAMWVVRDEDTTIYMFGTIHVLDGRRDWFNDEVKAAFDASQELVVEVRLPTDQAQQQQMMAPLLMRYAIDPEQRKLSSVLTTEENAKLYRILAPLGVPPNAFEAMEPWFVSLTLVQAVASRLNLDPEHGAEMVLFKAADARRMPVHQLETAESQFQIFDSMPRKDQIEGLKEAIADPDEGLRTLQPMLEAWSTGDIDRLAAIMTEDLADDPALYEALFTRRNANWARWIRERMERPGTVFLAVGAGHLGGRGSVQDQLQRLGLRAERVPAQ